MLLFCVVFFIFVMDMRNTSCIYSTVARTVLCVENFDIIGTLILLFAKLILMFVCSMEMKNVGK